MQLDNLPYGLAKMPTIIQVVISLPAEPQVCRLLADPGIYQVRDLYVQSFMKIAQLALIDSEAADEEFTELLERCF